MKIKRNDIEMIWNIEIPYTDLAEILFALDFASLCSNSKTNQNSAHDLLIRIEKAIASAESIVEV